MQHSIVYDFLTSKINNFQSKNVFVLVIEYLCAVYESPKIYLEINNLIKRAPKNIHVNLLLITDTDTDTNTKKLKNGYGYGYKKISGRIRIRMQKIFRADTDTDTIFVIFTDTVSVDGYLYPPDPASFAKIAISS